MNTEKLSCETKKKKQIKNKIKNAKKTGHYENK